MYQNHAFNQNVKSLTISESAVVERDKILGLQATLGVEPSREIVERAAFELSDRLNRLEQALYDGDLAQTAKIANSLVGISQQIGLISFAQIAADLVGAIRNNDFVAVAAISGRLQRQGEQALYQVVDYADSAPSR